MLDFALCWLTFLVLVALVYAWWLYRRCEYSGWEIVQYVPTYLVGRLLWRVSFNNDAPPEIFQGAILAANHRSSVDPFFVQLAARRRVHWLVAREYCQHFLFGFLLKRFQVIPTNRSGVDITATKLAIQYAREGRLVGMFPEGKINLTLEPLLALHAGAALVAVKACIPVIPIYIQGSPYLREVWRPLLMPAQVRITFGQPIFPHSKCTVEAVDGAESTTTASIETVKKMDVALEQSQEVIRQWAQQMMQLSGNGDKVAKIISSRRRSRSPSSPTL